MIFCHFFAHRVSADRLCDSGTATLSQRLHDGRARLQHVHVPSRAGRRRVRGEHLLYTVTGLITAHVRSTTGRYCFHRCLSVHTRGEGIPQGRYPSPSKVGTPLRSKVGTPPPSKVGTPSPQPGQDGGSEILLKHTYSQDRMATDLL